MYEIYQSNEIPFHQLRFLQNKVWGTDLCQVEDDLI